jgi:hypothetical protein
MGSLKRFGLRVLRRRLQRAKRKVIFRKVLTEADLARYVMTVLRGMAVQGANGAGTEV